MLHNAWKKIHYIIEHVPLCEFQFKKSILSCMSRTVLYAVVTRKENIVPELKGVQNLLGDKRNMK